MAGFVTAMGEQTAENFVGLLSVAYCLGKC